MIISDVIARLRELAARIPLPLVAHEEGGQSRSISINEFSPSGGRWIVGDIMNEYADDIISPANALPDLLDEIERLLAAGFIEVERANKAEAELSAALKRAEAAEKTLPTMYENLTLIFPLARSDQEYRDWIERLINKAIEHAGIVKVQESDRVTAGHLVIGYRQFASKPDSSKGGEG